MPTDVHSNSNLGDLRVTHIRLDLDADFDARVLSGTAALTLAHPEGSNGRLALDSRDLTVERVVDGAGRELAIERVEGPLGTALLLVPLLFGLSWYHSLMVGIPTKTALARAAAAALLAIPVQIVAIALALLTLPLGAGPAGRLALTHLPWMAVAAVSLAITELRFRLGRPAHEH